MGVDAWPRAGRRERALRQDAAFGGPGSALAGERRSLRLGWAASIILDRLGV